MKNRWNIEVSKGAKVSAHHPRGGTVAGYVTRLYTMQGYGKRVDLHNGHSLGIDDVFKVYEGIEALPDEWRAILGTLAHNRSFTKTELAEYVRFDSDPQRQRAAKALPLLRKLGVIKLTWERGHYYPTPVGWNWIRQD